MTDVDLLNYFKRFVMDRDNRRQKKTQMWISIGAVVLIILLILWLTIADIWGDTDVNAIVNLMPMW